MVAARHASAAYSAAFSSLIESRYRLMAEAMEGDSLVGASMSRRSPASLTAAAVAVPKAAMTTSSCLKSGKFLSSELMPCGLKNHCTGVVYLGIVQHLGVFAVADIGYGEDIVLVFVLGYKWHQVGEFAGLGGEDLAFAEHNVLLQIQCYGLGGAEVFHGVRHDEAHFFA